jgi:hypothetical protein
MEGASSRSVAAAGGSQLWTIDSTRVAFFLAFEHWPRGVVDFRDGDSRNLAARILFERERRARSTRRKGGLEAERAMDRATLARLAEGVATVEALAEADLVYMEVFRADRFEQVLLSDWLAHSPIDMVAETLNLDPSVVAGLPKNQPDVIGV